jgi:hypothetical protein
MGAGGGLCPYNPFAAYWTAFGEPTEITRCQNGGSGKWTYRPGDEGWEAQIAEVRQDMVAYLARYDSATRAKHLRHDRYNPEQFCTCGVVLLDHTPAAGPCVRFSPMVRWCEGCGATGMLDAAGWKRSPVSGTCPACAGLETAQTALMHAIALLDLCSDPGSLIAEALAGLEASGERGAEALGYVQKAVKFLMDRDFLLLAVKRIEAASGPLPRAEHAAIARGQGAP